ncbi:DNA-directed RNA polymerase subunit beta' [Haploplasma axanthum]|uniref:DNA-directed RNA polymerase subunit beta' n=2 Tax=Haploplasma axanthum TaxID=29552 RepID=A0A449BCM5_HAPAX|nr:DNA-directed RNA polymerase subunit beta' [Haploplasma axanthum]VEU80199.1 DNA-directed RNA polymerase subunit beta' [Haploplasma axanthum]
MAKDVLNTKVENLKLSTPVLDKLKLSGIDRLDDFNTFTLKELKMLLGETFTEVTKVLREYYLPSNLENLNLSSETLEILKNSRIDDLEILLNYDKRTLYDLFKEDSVLLQEINELLETYGFDRLVEFVEGEVAYHIEDDNKEISALDIDLKQRINIEVEPLRKGYGSRSYTHFKIRLASPNEIRQWSYGEVMNHETINYRTSKPEVGGLFCERIFGPTKDYQCACGKKQSGNKGQICPKCGIEITESKVRRERMGHINLEAPVVHTWYIKSSPSRLAILLGIKSKQLEEVVYHASYIVTDPGSTMLTKKRILSEQEYSQLLEQYPRQFTAQTGAEAIKTLLMELDLEKEVKILRRKIKSNSAQKRERAIKRLEVVEAFNNSDNKPEWMVLEVIPVIPPDLRPMVALDGGRFATTDLNDLYRRILNRNNRLKKQKEQHAPRLILKNEKRMLQEAVDALIDNSKRGKKAVVERGRNLKSLSDMLRCKQGRLRQNLLGKRVDYSGRSVIIVGPDLEMYQCGIPREMAITLFKPFILRELQKNQGLDKKNANSKYETMDDEVWQALEKVVVEHPVLLNRAPTLHRLGIQVFEPKLIDGKAIRLHPLVTPAFNADFDGDQMAVHVPLSNEAQAEARLLMLASNNILNPKDGKPVVTPSQDMVLGNYYLTIENELAKADSTEHPEHYKYINRNEGKFFFDVNEAKLAFEKKEIGLHTRIIISPKVLKHNFTPEQREMYLVTTLGKLIFNDVLPEIFYYLNEPTTKNLENGTPDIYFIPKGHNPLEYLANIPLPQPFNKKFLSQIISRVFKLLNISETSKILDKVKDLGFKYSTVAGFTISFADINVYSKKDELIKRVRTKIDEISEFFEMGLLTDDERRKLVIKEWEAASDEIKKGLSGELDSENHIYMMMSSGARGSISSFVQLSGMRGLMRNPKGETIEVPVQASFREGLTVSEFFISTHGARKGSTDTALKTAESGYLTRRLVDVSQEVIIVEDDCGSERGMIVRPIMENGKVIVPLRDRIIGRYVSRDVISNKKKKPIILRNELVTEEIADEIVADGITEVEIRNVFTCVSENGISAKSYGRNLATNTVVEVGDSVGVVAAQSIGEPGTQLTMRTFHTGGVASASDITQGLPRIQELFEARKPKGEARISEVNGKVKEVNRQNNGTTEIYITENVKDAGIYQYYVGASDDLYVKEGNTVIKGQALASNEVKSDVNGKIIKISNLNNDTLEISIKEEIREAKEYKYVIDPNVEILVRKNAPVVAGQKLCAGSINPKELLRVVSAEAAQNYILEEVQKVYRAQDVEISDKHVEIIVRQMFRRIYVVYEGDSHLLPGTEVSVAVFKDAVKEAITNGTRIPVGRPILLGITRASLRSDSFLSAASFQETTKILTEAAIRSSVDELHGLKENVIIGGLIPAGTGILSDKFFEYDAPPKTNFDDDDYDYLD